MNVADIAEYLGVTRQRVHQLVPSPGFPAPLARTLSREWDPADIEAWAARSWWNTKPWRGRPTASLSVGTVGDRENAARR
jgi:hypothetical protein